MLHRHTLDPDDMDRARSLINATRVNIDQHGQAMTNAAEGLANAGLDAALILAAGAVVLGTCIVIAAYLRAIP